jgi:ADP-ribosyl-[dinitrogen reductase] hydrolase
MRRTIYHDLPNPAELINPAVHAVLAAGGLLRAEFHRPGGPRGLGRKAPIDREIETLLRSRLLTIHSCDWRGEELPHASTGHSDIWIVDPNDGTRAFLKGIRGSAVSVALIRRGRPILGIVYAPMAPDDMGDLFVWADGLPPARNGVVLSAIGPKLCLYGFESLGDAEAPWPPAPARPKTYGADTIIGLNEEAADYAAVNHERLRPAGVLAIPSIAYRLALAAAGEVDVAVSLTFGLDAYDIAGGHALLTAVGGELVQMDGQPVGYAGSMTYRGCIGGRPELLGEVIARKLGGGQRIPRKPARPGHRTGTALTLRWAHGAMLGQLAGDALGSFVEFQSAQQIQERHPGGVSELRPGGTWDLLAGQPTDDSEMAFALARSIVATGGFDVLTVAEAYMGWGSSKPFDIGNTTRAGLSALEGRGHPLADSQSNGALMRVSPIGIFAAGRPELAARLAREDAALTHPHPVCMAASAAFAAAVAAGVGGADNRSMWSIAHSFAGDDPGGAQVRACLDRSLASGPDDFMKSQGWVMIALWNAFHRLWFGQSLEEALIETVGAGGDTDTNAAICGALLGAAQGRDAVPLRWRRAVLSCRSVAVGGVRHPRPTAYWPDDALDLAEALLVAGGNA